MDRLAGIGKAHSMRHCTADSLSRLSVIDRFGLLVAMFSIVVKMEKRKEKKTFHPSKLSGLHSWRLKRHLKQEGKFDIRNPSEV